MLQDLTESMYYLGRKVKMQSNVCSVCVILQYMHALIDLIDFI